MYIQCGGEARARAKKRGGVGVGVHVWRSRACIEYNQA